MLVSLSASAGFNSTLVRLEEGRDYEPKTWQIRFNSTLVRLEDDSLSAVSARSSKFQFHAGSIRGVLDQLTFIKPPPFQFHAGSIRGRNVSEIIALFKKQFQFHAGSIRGASFPNLPVWNHLSFNSTLVRLEVAGSSAGVRLRHAFQFHAGSIRGDRIPSDSVPPPKFQFHAGSIRGGPLHDVCDPCRTGFNSTLVRLERV